MNSRLTLAVSLAMNAVLLALGLALWRQGARQQAAQAALTASPRVAAEPESVLVTISTETSPDASPPPSASAFAWSSIESPDYRQYVANLRAVGCPERLMRDILVADIEALYRSRLFPRLTYHEPWVGRDRRATERESAAAARDAARQEKRALIRELLGYDWDAEFGEDWVTSPRTALLAGFLPEAKLARLLAISSEHEDSRRAIERAAGDILLVEDKARIREVRERMVNALRGVLTPAELEETQLRVQLGDGFPDGLHLEGVELTATELRELARASLAYRDVLTEELLSGGEGVSEEERDRRRQGFERAVEQRLGSARYADYQRAQQSEFREIFEFAQANNLAKSQAVRAYDYWRGAMAEAEAWGADSTLSAEERSTAAAVLRQTVTERFQGLLGARSLPEFFEHWTEQLVETVEAKAPRTGEE